LTGTSHKSHNTTSWDTATASWLSPGVCASNEELVPLRFQDKPGGSKGFGKWENGYISEVSEPSKVNNQKVNPEYGTPVLEFDCTNQELVSAGNGYTSVGTIGTIQTTAYRVDKRLTVYFAEDTMAGHEYVFEFQVTNPLKMQASPTISIDGGIVGHNDPVADFSAIGPSTHGRGCDSYLCKTESEVDGYFKTFCNQKDCAFAMDKDSDTVLCCTSCSVAANAVAGDAEPFKVHAPFFCVKTIGQSSPYPCDANTFGVTLAANVALKGKSTVVTFTGFTNANAPDCKSGSTIASTCVVDLQEGPNKMGQHNWFSSASDGETGKALWNQDTKTLTLYALLDVECTTEMQFRFVLENPSCEQDATTISVEATNVGNSEAMFQPGHQVGIAMAAMKSDDVTVLSTIKGAMAVMLPRCGCLN